MNGYWVGPYAPGGSGIFGGFIDYINMLNARDGGVNGVKLTYEKCETEYNNARGVECYERQKKKGPTGATVIHPLSTGITYSLIDKATEDKIPIISLGYGRTDASDGRVFPYVFPLITNYWSQNTAKIKFIGTKEGGMDKLKGKKIVNIYHDSAYGKETIPVLDAQAKKYGFDGHPHRGAASGQRAGRAMAADPPDQARLGDPARLGRDEPDGAQGRGQGRLSRAITSSASGGRARRKTRFPAGPAAKGYIAAGFNVAGDELPGDPGDQEVRVREGQGGDGGQDAHRLDLLQPRRGARHRDRRGDPQGAGEVRQEAADRRADPLGHREPADQRGALEGARRGRASCSRSRSPALDHEGGGAVKFQQWDGNQWKVITDWIQPDKELVRGMIEESAAAYAKEKKITPRDCGKET